MVFYSIRSRSKVVYKCNCHYYKNMDPDLIGSFITLDDARAAGYHICKHCAPMGRYYTKEYYKLKEFAKKNTVAIDYADGEIVVQTPYSNWKIIVNGKKHDIFLYHKNTLHGKYGRPSIVPGYHSQAVRRGTLMEYLDYIVLHDEYRMTHPISQGKQPRTLPKSKKKRKQALIREKKRERYLQAMRVLALIENEVNYRNKQYT